LVGWLRVVRVHTKRRARAIAEPGYYRQRVLTRFRQPTGWQIMAGLYLELVSLPGADHFEIGLPPATSQEIAMAKAKKRVATRKKSSKRGKVVAKPAHKKAAKRTAPSKAKSKIRSPSKRATRPAANKNLVPKTAARKEPRQVVEVPVEITTIDVIEEPVPGVVVVTEYESVQTATPVSPDTDTSPGTKK
jgi:hypothetical protein